MLFRGFGFVGDIPAVRKGETAMCKENTQGQQQEETQEKSETWAQDAVQELLDFWEEQGVYIRE